MNQLKAQIIFTILLFSCGVFAQIDSTAEVFSIVNREISYEFDTAKWYNQNTDEVIDFMSTLSDQENYSKNELVAVYTYNKFPVFNYPSIMIINTQTTTDPPSLDQMEKELGAIRISINDIDPNMKLKDHLKGHDIGRPILIKEKKQIIIESSFDLSSEQKLKVLQTMFFENRNIIGVQISYIENRDEKHLDDFYRIVETLKF